jgi:DNA-binding transcriptional MerR regulator
LNGAKTTQEARYKVGEVCRMAEVPPYVLRYWETEFPVLAPERPGSAPRIYSERDVQVIKAIRKLLYDEGYTIAGAKKRLESDLKREGLLGPGETVPTTAPERPLPSIETAELPFDGLTPPPPMPVRPEARARRQVKVVRPSDPLPGSDEVGAKLAAIDSLPPGRPVDRSPVEVVRLVDPRLAPALVELKEILVSLGKPID